MDVRAVEHKELSEHLCRCRSCKAYQLQRNLGGKLHDQGICTAEDDDSAEERLDSYCRHADLQHRFERHAALRRVFLGERGGYQGHGGTRHVWRWIGSDTRYGGIQHLGHLRVILQ